MDFLYTFLIDPLSYEFMQRGLIIASIVGVVCAVFSCFLVLKGWSLMGDAISHAVLPGIVIAYMLSLPLAIGAFVAGLGCALTSGYLKDNSRIKEDAVLGIVFSGMFAFGLVLMTKVQSDIHLLHILFGNMLGVSWGDIYETGAIASLTLLVIALKYKDLVLYCFDPSHAQTVGLPVKALHFGSLIFLALTIVAALKAAGIILVIAMLIAPGAIAYLLTIKFEKMLLIAVAVSLISCWLGTVISFHLDVATAPLIVVIQASAFLATLLWAPGSGLLRKTTHAI
jgi:manganese/iron transport system permease protein